MSRPSPDYVAAVQDLVASAPYPGLLGMRLAAMDLDSCSVELDVERKHLQPFGIVHGGVIATLIDTATFWAAFLRLPQDAGLVNVDLKLNYLEAVPAGAGRLRAEGTCLRPGRQVSYAEARVLDTTGRLVGHGTSTLIALPGKGLDLGLPKFVDG